MPGSVQSAFADATVRDTNKAIVNCLKYAPDRQDGNGRKSLARSTSAAAEPENN